MATLVENVPSTHQDFLPLEGTDYVEFYVGNACQSAYFYRAAFGMKLVAYAGPETGLRDRASYVVQQGKVRFVLTTALRSGLRDRPARPQARRWRSRHRPRGWRMRPAHGARPPAAAPNPWQSLRTRSDEHGRVVTASIAAYGDTSTPSSSAKIIAARSCPAITPMPT